MWIYPISVIDPTSTTTTTNLDETYPLDTSCDYLLHLDSPCLSSELQDTSIVENVEIEFLPEPEGKLDHTNLSPTDVFSTQHNYEGLNPTDTPSTVPTAIQATSDQTFNPMCAHNPLATQCKQSQYPNLNHNFALRQLMAQPNSEDLDPTDTPRAVPNTLQASCDYTFNPKCAHNLMETQCNQPQYLIPLNRICTHIPSASQNNQVSLSNSLASPYPPDPGEHV